MANNHNSYDQIPCGIGLLQLVDLMHTAGIIFGRDIERFAQFSVKNLIENGLMGEKSHSKM